MLSSIPLFGAMNGAVSTPIGGFVLRSSALAATRGILCAYPYDPHTFNTVCEPLGVSGEPPYLCVPGCKARWSTVYNSDAYDAEHLEGMLQDFVRRGRGNTRGYNEVVLDFDVWRSHLPDTILAFFYPALAACRHADECEARTRRAHRRFVSEYPASNVPLLTLDQSAWQAPFAVAPG